MDRKSGSGLPTSESAFNTFAGTGKPVRTSSVSRTSQNAFNTLAHAGTGKAVRRLSINRSSGLALPKSESAVKPYSPSTSAVMLGDDLVQQPSASASKPESDAGQPPSASASKPKSDDGQPSSASDSESGSEAGQLPSWEELKAKILAAIKKDEQAEVFEALLADVRNFMTELKRTG